MKKNIFKIILLLFPFLTFAQNNVSSCNYNDSIFKVLPSEMTFNVEKYKTNKNKGEIVILNNDKYYSTIQIDSTETSLVKINKKLKIDKTIYYYSNGKIRRNYFYYKPSEESTSREIGITTTYSPDGTIQEIYDYDKGYKICYDEVIPIIKKRIGSKKIKKYNLKFSLGRVDLNQFPNGRAKWFVSVEGNDKYQKKINPANKYEYIIDGVTGKILGILKNHLVP